MGYVLSVFLTCSSWLRGNSVRKPRGPLVGAMLWGWMWVLTWANTGNPDLQGYEYLYDSDLSTEGIGPGYWLLLDTARHAGATYPVFVALTAGFGFSLMAMVAWRFTERFSLVAALYFVYPFVYDAIQVRNLLAMSFVILGFACLVTIRRGGTVAFLGLVAIGMTIHVTMVVFLVVFAVMGRVGSVLARGLALLGFFGTVLAIIEPGLVRVVGGALVARLGVTRFEAYFETDARVGVVMFLTLHLLTVLVLRETLKVVVIGSPGNMVRPSRVELLRVRYVAAMYRTSLALTLVFPMVALNSNMWRLFRDTWILYAIAFVIGVDMERGKRQRRFLSLAVGGVTALHCLLPWGLQFEHVVRPILEQNWILDYLQGLL